MKQEMVHHIRIGQVYGFAGAVYKLKLVRFYANQLNLSGVGRDSCRPTAQRRRVVLPCVLL